MAELTATHLRSHRVGRICVASRTPSHAATLAAEVDGESVPWGDITAKLSTSDIVVTATGSSAPIVSRQHIETAMARRRNRPLFIIDIGLPRDVEPSSGDIEQVFLYNIDDLRAIVRENLARRQSQVDQAELMVDEEVDRFTVWLRSRAAIPTVVALRRRFETIRQSELERLAPKLNGLPPASRDRVEEITRLLVEKLLSAPTEALKAASDEKTVTAYADALNRLFKLRDDTGDTTPEGLHHARAVVRPHAEKPLNVLRIGTRGSPLALWQARAVQAALAAAEGPPTEIVTIRTTGDRLVNAVLTEVGGKAVFVKEIEEALLGHTIDLAVHSAKDLPSVLPDGLGIAAVLPRADPRDALVTRTSDVGASTTTASILSGGPSPPRVGTGSVRRIAQLARRYPEARFEPIRGNVDTRLRKLDDGAYDVLVLAAAGLDRLGLGERIAVRLPLRECVPAPGQGIVAIETRVHDEETRAALALIDHATTRAALRAERAVLTTLGGDCHVPIGAFSTAIGDDIVVDAIVASTDGTTLLAGQRRGPHPESEQLGRQVAQDLIEDGALAIIAAGRPSDLPRDAP